MNTQRPNQKTTCTLGGVIQTVGNANFFNMVPKLSAFIHMTVKRIKAHQDKVSVKRKNMSIGKETFKKVYIYYGSVVNKS